MNRLLTVVAFFWASLLGASAPDLEQAKSDAAGALAYASLVREQPLPLPTPTLGPARAEQQPITDAAAAVPAEEVKPAPAASAPRPTQPARPVGRATFGQPVYRVAPQPTHQIQAAPSGWQSCPGGNCGPRFRRW